MTKLIVAVDGQWVHVQTKPFILNEEPFRISNIVDYLMAVSQTHSPHSPHPLKRGRSNGRNLLNSYRFSWPGAAKSQ